MAIVLHHTAGNRPVGEKAALEAVRSVQRMHQEQKGWTDVAYNYLVTPSGRLLEGRGWEFQNGANTGRGFISNRNSVSVCLLGNFENDRMTAAEKSTVKATAYSFGLPVIPHSDVSATACPGNHVRAWLNAGMPVLEDERADRAAAAFAELRRAVDRLGDALS